MSMAHAHLRRILSRAAEIIADEELSCSSLQELYPGIGDLHPALCRENHVRSLLFAGLRAAGYPTFAEGNYFEPGSNARQVDLVVWLPDVRVWFFLELKPCGPQAGWSNLREDTQKLLRDYSTDPRDQLRGVLAWGFRDRLATGRDHFEQKYRNISPELAQTGFVEVGVHRRNLDGDQYQYVLVGLWVLGLDADMEPMATGGFPASP